MQNNVKAFELERMRRATLTLSATKLPVDPSKQLEQDAKHIERIHGGKGKKLTTLRSYYNFFLRRRFHIK